MRTIRDGEPRTATSTLTQLMSSDPKGTDRDHFLFKHTNEKLDRKGELRELYYIRIKILGSCLFLQLPLLICTPIGYKERERERDKQTDRQRETERQATHKRERARRETDRERQKETETER